MVLDSGDTAWILASAALVMLMTPGVGFFYGGMVRRKNVIAMIALSFIAFALVSIQWILWGYTLAFGPDIHGLVGGLSALGLAGVGMGPGPFAQTVPGLAYMVFQARLCHGDPCHPHLGLCRAGEALVLHHLRAPLDDPRLRPPRPLGLGRRVDRTDGGAGLCRRDCCPYLRRFLGTRHHARDRETEGVR